MNRARTRFSWVWVTLDHCCIALRLGEDGGHGQDGREGTLLAQTVTGIGKAEEDLAQPSICASLKVTVCIGVWVHSDCGCGCGWASQARAYGWRG
ncbi:hypothetical protein AFERRI_240007 [Acidithiobacillus ferrivorans]|uniref:Uncharacterized protein n=1 Tax=Acidithiobacillus ferrivorans TaxID=160808 RepID=A0A060UQU4_9PROT|nr:hypothetical protein AFERRI_240007 [Acidithiobacillus ferrivorans]